LMVKSLINNELINDVTGSDVTGSGLKFNDSLEMPRQLTARIFLDKINN